MKFFLLILFFLVSAGCGAAPVVKISRSELVPPGRPETLRYRQVAVLPFDGPAGEQTADVVGRTMSRLTVKGKPVYSVEDYRKLKDISGDHYAWAMNPPVNTETYREMGRMLGVNGVYAGTVTRASADEDYSRSRKTECERFDAGTNKCLKEKKLVERCKQRGASLAFTIRLIDVLSGSVVYSQDFYGESASRDCDEQDVTGDSTKKIIAGDVLYHAANILFGGDPQAAKDAEFDAARGSAISSFLSAVSPHYQSMEIMLMNPGREVSSKEVRERVIAGLEAAKQNQMDRACVLWAEADGLQPGVPSLLYNLGVCAEMKENFPAAAGLYRKAETVVRKRDAFISQGLLRVENSLEMKKRLERLGY